jgi:hypothetical protein
LISGYSTKKQPVTASESGAGTFDYSEYEKLFPILKEIHHETARVSGVYCEYIKKLIREGRISNAVKYWDSYNVIKRFGGNIYFQHITVVWFRSSERWMLGKGRSRATVGGEFCPTCGAYLTKPMKERSLISKCATYSEGGGIKSRQAGNGSGYWTCPISRRSTSACLPVLRKPMPNHFGFSCILGME